MGSLIVILAFTLCGVCLARPSNTTSYECFTEDDCNDENVTWSSIINDKVFCCNIGDAISTSYRSKAFLVYSSIGVGPNDTSGDEQVDRNETTNQELQGGRRVKPSYTSEFTCKCGEVNYQEVESKITKFYRKMSKFFRAFIPKPFWFL